MYLQASYLLYGLYMRGEQKGTGPVQVTGSTAVRTVCRYSPSSARVRPSITRVGCSQGHMMKYIITLL